MPIDRDSPLLGPEFSATARSGLSAATAATWSPTLPRDPRLLVPVDVEALIIPPGAAPEAHADIAGRLLRAPDAPGETFADDTAPAPPPFTDAPARPAGAYLHWALPDGLTAGRVTDGTDPDGRLNLAPLPDRWLVVRLGDERPRTLTAWVIEADRKRRVRLADWREDPDGTEGETPTLDPAGLTAVSGGDPAWAAVFDNVEDRFAMYDDLAGVGAGATVSYVVVGWYSRAELDPLRGAGDLASFTRRLAELHWSVDEARLAAAFARSRARADAAGARKLATPPPQTGPFTAEAEVEGRSVPVPGPAGSPKIAAAGARILVHPAPSGPRQSLFHGTVHGVRVDGAGGDARPRTEDLTLAVGATSVEAMAASLRSRLQSDAATERLLCAFGYRVLGALGRPDGLVAFDEEVHRRAFVSLPGGSVEERIRMGDALAGLRPPPPPAPGTRGRGGGRDVEAERPGFEALARDPRVPASAVEEAAKRLVGGRVRFDLVERDPASVAGIFTGASVPSRVPSADPPRIVTVRRALPRWYFPADPVVVAIGLNRSLRHGHDGRLEPDETLACRLSDEIATGYQGLLAGADLVSGSLEHGGVPDEADELVREAALRDWGQIDAMIDTAARGRGLPRAPVAARMQAERDLALHGSLPGRDSALLLPGSLIDGRIPSAMWVTYWRQPWVPLYLEWELELRVDDRLDRWTLGEVDLEPAGEPAAGAPARTVRGRALLSSGATKALVQDITEFLAQETLRDQEGTGIVSDLDAALLRDLGERAGRLDALGAALEGIREFLLGFDTNAGLSGPDDEHVEPAPSRDPELVRGGTATLARLRVVDAFGRTLELDPAALQRVTLSDQLEAGPATLLLPPRVTAPSRLLLRFVDPTDEEVEARVDQEDPARAVSPVAGWLLPDHVDGALELFDAEGEPAGQLLHEGLGGAVVYEGAPGVPGPAGVAPRTDRPGDRHLAAFAVAVARRDAEDRKLPAEARPGESALAALLRVIDTTLWTVDPFGSAGVEHLSVLTGRPLALVRARLELEVRSDVDELPLDPAAAARRQARFDALAATAFPVRLGALTRGDDGLLGYFLDDDYRVFHPLHDGVLRDALPAGPQQGFLGSPAEVGAFAGDLGSHTAPIRHPFVQGRPELLLRAGQRRTLTLLVVPGGAVHLTSGISPRKDVALLRSWTAEPLGRIAPSFRVGPVLVDPETIRMPRVSTFDPEQVFTRRTGPESWRDDPIVAASQQALLPDTPAEAQEGYLRVRIEQEDGPS
ncbi:MAG TPA: hypothetical protein VEK86_12000 [Gemmatimonadales bacterium]|nr:hypothetical protein [Gemmatimonadales bacterium]